MYLYYYVPAVRIICATSKLGPAGGPDIGHIISFHFIHDLNKVSFVVGVVNIFKADTFTAVGGSVGSV